MVRLAIMALCFACAPAAAAQTQLSDFAGLWQNFGPRMGPGGPGGPPPGPRRDAAGPSARLSPDGPAPMPAGRPSGLSDADAALGLDGGDIRVRELMTPAGRARFAEFDPADHPMYNCISPGLPTVMMMPGLQDWSVSGDTLSVRQDVWQEARTASLSAVTLADGPHSRQGLSSATLKDGALIITTTRLSEAWGGLSRNAPGSAGRTVVETYRLADTDTIRGEIVITDPLYLTQKLSRQVLLRRAPDSLSFETFPCERAPYGLLSARQP